METSQEYCYIFLMVRVALHKPLKQRPALFMFLLLQQVFICERAVNICTNYVASACFLNLLVKKKSTFTPMLPGAVGWLKTTVKVYKNLHFSAAEAVVRTADMYVTFSLCALDGLVDRMPYHFTSSATKDISTSQAASR